MAVGAVSGGANVQVTGRRVLAIIVDTVLLSIVGIVMSVLFGSGTTEGASASFSLTGLPAVVYFLIIALYFILLEGTAGQTVGKMLLGIQVLKEDTGQPPGMGGATLRTLLRIVDGFLFYLVGFIIVLISGKNQRLGDMVAGTLVVRKGSGTGSRVV